MKERRLFKRHAVRLSSRIEAIIPSGKKKTYDFETKDISIGGAFFYTKEWYSFPEGTRFVLDLTIPSDSNKELETVKNLMECTGTIVRLTSEGIAIKCDKPVNLENYQAKRIEDGVAPSTIDQEIGKVRAMIYKAFDNDLVGVNAIKTFKKIKKLLKPGSDVRDRILSPAEFKALMKHAKAHLKPIIAAGYHTGMRKGEILNLTWDKVGLANRMIRLEAGDTKDKEARNVPINDELYKILVSLPNRLKNTDEDEDDHVFQYKGEKIKGDIRDSLKKACKKAGIKYGRFVKGGFIFHDLRHTFNTNMRKAGVSESVIMDITGHSTREMFDRYNTVDEDDRHQAVNEMIAYLKSVDQTVDQGNKKALSENDQSL